MRKALPVITEDAALLQAVVISKSCSLAMVASQPIEYKERL